LAISENVAGEAATGAMAPGRKGCAFGRRRADRARPQGYGPAPGGFGIDAETAVALTLLEGFAITVSSLVAGFAYSRIALHYTGDTAQFLGNGILVTALFCCAMRARDAHRIWRVSSEAEALRDLFAIWFAVFSVVGFLWFFLKFDPNMSRGAFLGFFALGFVAVAAARARAPELVAAWYHPRRFAGHNVVLVGARNTHTLDALREEFGFTGCGKIAVIAADAGEEDWPQALAAAVRDIRARAREARPGQICVTAEGFTREKLSDLLIALQSIPRAIRLVPDDATQHYLHMPLRNLGRLRAVEIQRAPLNAMQRRLKRWIDLAIAIPCLVLAAPAMSLIAIAVRIDSKGPTLFRQKRLGYRGRPFVIYKFRTMHVLEDGAEIAQARRDDARITRLGHLLRSASLDELPQLFNVIKGDMSLVGPRPHAVAHDHLFAALIGNYELRQHVMPGVTGWALVHGLRGETATTDIMRKRVEFDLWYVKNASLLLDLQILARTAVEVFRQHNAH
jgi:Undecaprenyl-phosphate glucose phosphotransferase